MRFRHNDSDFVRESRQQDFLRWAKQNFSTASCSASRTELLNDFGKNVQTDHCCTRPTAYRELFNLAINANGTTIKSIPFPVAGEHGGSATT